jgi:hypothetical protein
MVVWCGVIIISSNPRSSFYNKVEKSLNSSTKGTLNTLHTANQHNTTQHNRKTQHNTHVPVQNVRFFYCFPGFPSFPPKPNCKKISLENISTTRAQKICFAASLWCYPGYRGNLANWIFQYSNIYRNIKYILI